MAYRTCVYTLLFTAVFFVLSVVLSTAYLVSTSNKLYNSEVNGCNLCPDPLSFREVMYNILDFETMYNLEAACSESEKEEPIRGCDPNNGSHTTLIVTEYCYIIGLLICPIVFLFGRIACYKKYHRTEELYCGYPMYRLPISNLTTSPSVTPPTLTRTPTPEEIIL